MKNFDQDQLKILNETTDNKNKMTWLGTSDYRDPAKYLNPYFDSIIQELAKKDVIIDFYEFKYMNSSTVTSIIYLVELLNSKGIKTVINYKASSKWQSASFKAIKTLSEDMDYIKVEGK